ncbi:hypothetical protein ABTX81_22805 [Kitasatospora sp. NPDC097605]|uniref:hypothetical protein n=1 Tax=Kitasatospora sp. NPDC097605 TaxID=3157226 RepID=UPI003320A91D
MAEKDWAKIPTPYAKGLTGAVILAGKKPEDDVLWTFRGTWFAEFRRAAKGSWAASTDCLQHLTVRWPELRFTAGRHPYRAAFVAGDQLWMFRGDRYLKLDLEKGGIVTPDDADPAKFFSLDQGFAHGITAATAIGDSEAYLFNGNDYYVCNLETGLPSSSRMTLEVGAHLEDRIPRRTDAVCFDPRSTSSQSLHLLHFVWDRFGDMETKSTADPLKITGHGATYPAHLEESYLEGPYDRLYLPDLSVDESNTVQSYAFTTDSVLAADTPNTVDFDHQHGKAMDDIDALAFPGDRRRLYACLKSTVRSLRPSELEWWTEENGVSTTLANGELRIHRAHVVAGGSRLLVCGTRNGKAAIAVPRTAALDAGSGLEEKDTYLAAAPGTDVYTAVPALSDTFCVVTQSKLSNGTLLWFEAPKDAAVTEKYRVTWPALIGFAASFDGTYLYHVSADGKSLCRAETGHWGTPTALVTYPHPLLSACDPVAPPDDRLLAVGRTDGKVDLHYRDTTTHTVALTDDGVVTGLAVDPNGNRVFALLRTSHAYPRLYVIDIEAPVPGVITAEEKLSVKVTDRPRMVLCWSNPAIW